jgi:hypothetical protein
LYARFDGPGKCTDLVDPGPPTAAAIWLVINTRRVVSRIFASWNQLDGWLRQVQGLKRVA